MHCVISPLGHIVILSLLGVIPVIIKYIRIYTLVSLDISFFISQHSNCVPFLGMVLFKRIFSVFVFSVIVMKSPEKLMRFTPATSLVRLGFTFWGL